MLARFAMLAYLLLLFALGHRAGTQGQDLWVVVFSVLVGALLIDALLWSVQRGQLVSAVVRSVCGTTHDGYRWRGSRIRLWVALFVLGACGNAHGQRVDMTTRAP